MEMILSWYSLPVISCSVLLIVALFSLRTVRGIKVCDCGKDLFE